MNLLPLATLLLAGLALAVSLATLLTVLIRRPRRQTQTSGHNAVQFQSGGNLHIDETAPHRAERIARNIIKNGRHL